MNNPFGEKAQLEGDMLNMGKQLLSEGRTVVYPVSDLPPGQLVRHYPDGRKMIVKAIDGKIEEIGKYEDSQ